MLGIKRFDQDGEFAFGGFAVEVEVLGRGGVEEGGVLEIVVIFVVVVVVGGIVVVFGCWGAVGAERDFAGGAAADAGFCGGGGGGASFFVFALFGGTFPS